jgi:hypothetical protein
VLLLVFVVDPLHVGVPVLAQTLHGGDDLLLKDAVDLLQLGVLLVDRAQGRLLLHLEHSRAGGLFDHRKDLWWLHVKHLSDLSLHDEEVRIVDVELDGVKEGLDLISARVVSIDQVLVAAADYDLRRGKYG